MGCIILIFGKLSSIDKNKKINLKNKRQKGLRGAFSTKYHTNKVHLLYDFGNILILHNQNGFAPEAGADFNYFNPWINEEGKEVNIGFDMSDITGVLIAEQ